MTEKDEWERLNKKYDKGGKKSKTKWIILLTVLLVILAGSAYAYLYFNSNLFCSIDIPFEIYTKDVSVCNKICDDKYRDSCYSSIAERKLDPNICDMISEQESKITCYSVIATMKEDSTICNKIEYEKIKRDFCYGVVNLNSSICKKIYQSNNTYERTVCYLTLAVLKRDLNTCNMISNRSNRDDCYISIISITEREKLNSTVCKNILSNITKSLCYALTTQNPNICTKMVNQVDKDDCLMNLALITKDPHMCYNISKYYLSSCYSNVASVSNDTKICDKYISTQSGRDYCYENVAISSDNANLCGKIVTSSIKDECYQNLASSRANPDLCDKITDQATRYLCHMVVK